MTGRKDGQFITNKRKKMYRKPDMTARRGMTVNEGVLGISIERKIEAMMESGEELGEAIKPMYTDKKDGVLPSTDIRTDRHVIAAELSSKTAKRDRRGATPTATDTEAKKEVVDEKSKASADATTPKEGGK